MRGLRRLSFLALILVLAVSLAACGGSSSAPRAAEESKDEGQEQPAEPKIEKIRIGAIYPVTGPAAATGTDLTNGIKLAVEIVNEKFPDLNMPLADGEGLSNLGGAKIEMVWGDHQASAEKGLSEAERLITQEKVTALLGSYHSAVTATASQAAERYGVPFVNPESTSPTLITRGFQWFFRTTPDDDIFAKNFFDFLDDLKGQGIEVSDLGIVYENTLWGQDVGKFEKKYAEEYGYNVVEDLPYPAKGTNVTSEVQRLKRANPDVIMQASYESDAILYMKTYKEANYAPQALLAMDAGFISAEYLKSLGEDGWYILSREVWALDLAKNKPIIAQVNDLYKERFGDNMNGNSARAFTGAIVLFDAINRAGSTEPEAIKAALLETDIPAEQLIMPWEGVKFDPETHQNTRGRGIIVQVQDGKYLTVWPWDLASADLIWPMPKWSER